MNVVVEPKVDEYCCDSMRGLVQSGDVVVHNTALVLRYASLSAGEERFFDLVHCPKCGQKIELNAGRQPVSVTVPSVAPPKLPPIPVAKEARVRSTGSYIVVIAGLLGVGLFIFVQFAFAMLSDLMGWSVAETAEQCEMLYTAGNIPMYSCGLAP